MIYSKNIVLALLALNSADFALGDDKQFHLVKQWNSLFGPDSLKEWDQISKLPNKRPNIDGVSTGYIIANQYQPTNVWYPHWCDFKTTSAFGIATGKLKS